MLKVGLILYSVRQAMAQDTLGTVEAVAKLGYRYIEVCNHNADKDPGCGFGVDAGALKETFDRFGSQVVSAHIHPLDQCDLKAVLAYNRALGNRNIVNPMAHFDTYDQLMRQCEDFNRIGKLCREEGMTYLYHNHCHEFRTFGGKPILDWIVENTDPEYLSLELDTFWTMRGGVSPVEQLRHYGSRVKLVHQKDFAWDSLSPINLVGITPEQRELAPGETASLRIPEEERPVYNTAFTEIGTGIMPIQAIIDAANEYTDAEYIILEQDATRMPSELDSVRRSMEGFRKFTGISW